MKQRLPSLLAIRYFEAVGRNLSFTLAASELNVTQAAVSHQIRLLEQELGAKLFHRYHQRIELTQAGIDLLNVAIECFGKLADVTNSISVGKTASRIHLSTPPLFSAHVLMPQIDDFLAEEPDVDVVIHHSLSAPSEKDPPYDLKLFFSRLPLQDSNYRLLLKDQLVPMCTPEVLQKHRGSSLADLLYNAPLVHEFDYHWWEEWSQKSGYDRSFVRKGLAVDNPAVLESAALLGRGLILGSSRFLSHRLQSGELLAPFGLQTSIEVHYYLASGRTKSRRDVAKLSSWLKKISMELSESQPPLQQA